MSDEAAVSDLMRQHLRRAAREVQSAARISLQSAGGRSLQRDVEQLLERIDTVLRDTRRYDREADRRKADEAFRKETSKRAQAQPRPRQEGD